MESFLNETANSSTIVVFQEESNGTNKLLPIDMRFNDGHVLSIAMYTILLVLSAIGNITLLIAIVWKNRRLNLLTRIDLLLSHLAVADLMVTVFMKPLEIGWALTVYWRAGDLLCRIMAFFRIFGIYLTGFVLVCMAVDRYMAVRYPMQGLSSKKRVKVMIIGAWLLSSVCSFPQVLIFHVESHPDFPWYTQCVTFNSFSNPEYELLYAIFGMVMMYALPFLLLAILHGSIAMQLFKMSRATPNPFANASLSTIAFPGIAQAARLKNIERAKVKSIKMMFVITAAFLVCWTPYYVMCIWYWVDPETAKGVDQRIQKALFLFACTNSTVNPIVYGLFNIKSVFGRDKSAPGSVTTGRTSIRTLSIRPSPSS